MILIILMIIGGGAGSTAGGIKYSRVYIIFRSFIFDIKTKFLPERAVNEAVVFRHQGKKYITPKYITAIYHFVFAYICVFCIGVLVMTFTGIPLEKAMFEFA